MVSRPNSRLGSRSSWIKVDDSDGDGDLYGGGFSVLMVG
jgi:hypothetical protein